MERRDVKYTTTRELAEEIHVDPSTLRRWVESGKLVPAMTTPGGHHRFVRETALKQLGVAAVAS